ncbi:MAG: hypothetical protein ACTSXQ_04010 [Alphaproteobacteria bacterium]
MRGIRNLLSALLGPQNHRRNAIPAMQKKWGNAPVLTSRGENYISSRKTVKSTARAKAANGNSVFQTKPWGKQKKVANASPDISYEDNPIRAMLKEVKEMDIKRGIWDLDK